jgi:hypothetical protein
VELGSQKALMTGKLILKRNMVKTLNMYTTKEIKAYSAFSNLNIGNKISIDRRFDFGLKNSGYK